MQLSSIWNDVDIFEIKSLLSDINTIMERYDDGSNGRNEREKEYPRFSEKVRGPGDLGTAFGTGHAGAVGH